MISRYPYVFDSQNPSQNPTIDEVDLIPLKSGTTWDLPSGKQT